MRDHVSLIIEKIVRQDVNSARFYAGRSGVTVTFYITNRTKVPRITRTKRQARNEIALAVIKTREWQRSA